MSSQHYEDEDVFYPISTFLRDHEFFVGQPSSRSNGVHDTGSLRTRVADLETEVQQLREYLGKAKGINETMWNTVVQRVVVQAKQKPLDSSTPTSDRPRKRGRIDA